MKNVLIKAALLVTSFSLVVGCATNTRNQNTAIGAVSGGVVGGLAGAAVGGGAAVAVGTVAGAIVGGVIGNNMESSDNQRVYYVMEHNHSHKATHWKNKKTNKHYTVIPTSEHIAYKGNTHCRNYQVTMYSNGKKEETTGTMCRQANGTWQSITA